MSPSLGLKSIGFHPSGLGGGDGGERDRGGHRETPDDTRHGFGPSRARPCLDRFETLILPQPTGTCTGSIFSW
jgi:hypothetical protein